MNQGLLIKNFRWKIDQHILSGDTFDLPAQQIIFLQGPSGSGKSNFLKSLVKFYDIEYESFCINGQHRQDLTDEILRSKMIYVSQFFQTHLKTFQEIFDFILQFKSQQNKKIEEFKIFLQQKNFNEEIDFMNRPVDRLSGGQRSSMILLFSLFLRPQILILDEVFAPLSFDLKEKLAQLLITQLQNNWIDGVIYTGHHQSIFPQEIKYSITSNELKIDTSN